MNGQIRDAPVLPFGLPGFVAIWWAGKLHAGLGTPGRMNGCCKHPRGGHAIAEYVSNIGQGLDWGWRHRSNRTLAMRCVREAIGAGRAGGPPPPRGGGGPPHPPWPALLMRVPGLRNVAELLPDIEPLYACRAALSFYCAARLFYVGKVLYSDS